MAIVIKTKKEINIMRQNCHILASILQQLKNASKPGVSGMDLERLAMRLIKEKGGMPSFKGVYDYPYALCFSLNEEIVHAIPREDKIIKMGDLVSLDLGVYKNGFHSDMAISFAIGKVNEKITRLIKTTQKALMEAIKIIRPGIKLGKISNTIQNIIENEEFSVIKDLTGHGVGKELHEDPSVFNYGSPNSGPTLKQGMILAIEPMASLGSGKIKDGRDGYAYTTKDYSISCHFEHTILITKHGHEILTQNNLN